MPPIALSHMLLTIFGVSPIYFPTSVARLASITRLVGRISIACNTSPILRATDVLPVPGLPVRMKFIDICCTLPAPIAARCFMNMLWTARRRIIFFTERMPMKSSSSLSTSSSGRAFSAGSTSRSAEVMRYMSSSLKSGLPIMLTRRWLCFSTAWSKIRRASRALPKFLSRRRYSCSNWRWIVPCVSSSTVKFLPLARLMKICVSSSGV